MERALRIGIALLVNAFFSHPAAAQESLWLAPIDGAFSDPARWSNGVPTFNTQAVFGAVPGRPFTVTVAGETSYAGISVASQSPILDGTNSRDPAMTVWSLFVAGAAAPTLTIKDCTVTCTGFLSIIGSTSAMDDGPGALVVADDGALVVMGELRIGNTWSDVAALLDLAPHASLNVQRLTCDKTIRWTIEGSDACLVNASEVADFRGTIRIAFGPDGPPRPGAVVALANHVGCNAVTVVIESSRRPPIDGVVTVDDGTLVYRQLTEPLQLTIDVPTLPSPGYQVFVDVLGVADGQSFDVAGQATLVSSDPNVLQVVGPRRVFGVAPGQAMLTATVGSASTSVLVTVGDEPSQFDAIDDNYCDAVILQGMSHSGREVVFWSNDPNLVRDDTNGKHDVFVRDMETGAYQRVSEGPNGEQGSQESTKAVISGGGRFVAFFTNSPEIIGVPNVWILKDRMTGAIELAAPGFSQPVVRGLSFDGRYVAFVNGSYPTFKPYVRDRVAGTTSSVGIAPDGQPLASSELSAMSSDGRFVALVGTYAGQTSLMVRDLVAGTTELVVAMPFMNGAVGMSDDARYLAFVVGNIFQQPITLLLRDRIAETTTTIASPISFGNDLVVTMSANGRYVAFLLEDLSPCGAEAAPGQRAMRYDRVLGTLQAASARVGEQPSGYTDGRLSLSADGRYCSLQHYNGVLLPPGFSCVHALRRRFGPVHGADINADGAVDASDVALFIAAWGSNDFNADLDGDGVVGPADLAVLLAAWTNGT